MMAFCDQHASLKTSFADMISIPEVISTHVFPRLDLASAMSLGATSRAVHALFVADRKARSPAGVRIAIGPGPAISPAPERVASMFASMDRVRQVVVTDAGAGAVLIRDARSALTALRVACASVTAVTLVDLRSDVGITTLLAAFPALDSLDLANAHARLLPRSGVWLRHPFCAPLVFRRVRVHYASTKPLDLSDFDSIKELDLNENVAMAQSDLVVGNLRLTMTRPTPPHPSGAPLAFLAPSGDSGGAGCLIKLRGGSGSMTLDTPGATDILVHGVIVPYIPRKNNNYIMTSGVRIGFSPACSGYATLRMRPLAASKTSTLCMHCEVL
jgi:hypothetical protein